MDFLIETGGWIIDFLIYPIVETFKGNFEFSFLVYGLVYILIIEFISVGFRWGSPRSANNYSNAFSYSSLFKRRKRHKYMAKDNPYAQIVQEYLRTKNQMKLKNGPPHQTSKPKAKSPS